MSFRRIVLALSFTLLMVTATAWAASVPGVTDTEVVIGCTTPLSGPAALWGTTGLGMKAWADYINDQGGIHGRKIKFVMKDDAYNPTRGLANLQEMKGNVFAVCGVLGTAILNASKDFYTENKIPLITAYADVRIWEKMPKDMLKYVFIAYPDYGDEAEYLTKYAIDKLGSKKIALFYQNDDYGKHAMEGLKKQLAANPGKAELVGAVPYELAERALGTHALKLKESGADTLLIYTTPTHGALILKEIHKIGFKPKALTTFTLGDPIMYKLAGDVWEGTYMALPGNSGLPGSDPAADKIVEILLQKEPSLRGKEYLALFGAMSMIHMVEGLKNAGKDLTPETLLQGMEKIKEWKAEGVGAPVTYSPERRHGVNASRMGIAKEGKHVPIEEFTIFKPRF